MPMPNKVAERERIKIEYIPIATLIPSEYNPRQILIKTKTGIAKYRWVKKCLYCSEEYLVTKHFKDKRKYCSKKCALEANAVKNLGKWTKPEKIALRNKEKWFRKKVSEGLKQYYKKHRLNLLSGKRTDWRVSTWRGIRKAILEKYDYQCIRCKKKARLDIHHIIPERAGGGNEIRNLVPLCRKCHQFIEKNQLGIYNIVKNWEITAIAMRDSFLMN